MEGETPDAVPARATIVKLPAAAAIVALLGLADAIYLTIHHYTEVPVPCSITGGCEQVLTSQWAEINGVPLALFGAVGYFIAFSLALLAAFGDRRMWLVYGVQATIMAAISAYLVYVQGALIGALCQFCLLSALTSLTLFLIFIFSLLRKSR